MTAAPEPVADPTSCLGRRNPVAKAGAALFLVVPLISTVDLFVPAAVLAVEALVLPFFGVRAGALARRVVPPLLAVAAVLVAAVLAVTAPVGAGSGEVPVVVAALVLRVFAVALPVIVVLATTDPTDLADALMQNARMPARFAIGVLAVFRLLPLLGQERRALALARRARGADAGLRFLVSTAITLPAGLVRRGVRLAVALDARGFDAGAPRTYARRQRFVLTDFVLLGVAFAGSALIVAVSVVSDPF